MQKETDIIYSENGDLDKPANKPSKKFLSAIIWILIALALAFGTYFLTTSLFARLEIKGSSMEPTIINGEDVLVFETKKIKYDDVIVFYSPALDENLIKRVIGKEGDVITTAFDEEKNCYHVLRNGELLSEEHIKAPMVSTAGWRESETVVPKGKIYVLGDNRNGSLDSYDGILADADKVLGKAVLRISQNNSFHAIH